MMSRGFLQMNNDFGWVQKFLTIAAGVGVFGLSLAPVHGQDGKLESWSDISGSFKIEAAFVKIDGDAVLIKTAQGKELTIPLAKLSLSSQLNAKKLANPKAFEKPAPVVPSKPIPGPASKAFEEPAGENVPINSSSKSAETLSTAKANLGTSPIGTAGFSAKEIIAKSEAAYAAVTTYVGTTTVQMDMDRAAKKTVSFATANITFERPGKFRIQGTSMSRDATGKGSLPYTVVSDGKTTWRSFAPLDKGVFVEVKDLTMAGMAGVGMGAAEGIPAALMKTDGKMMGAMDPFMVPRMSAANLEGHEMIAGSDCYKLVAIHPAIGSVALWIDSKSFLLRQMTSETNSAKTAEALAKTTEALKKSGVAMPANLLANRPPMNLKRVVTFKIDKLDERVDTKLFANPINGP